MEGLALLGNLCQKQASELLSSCGGGVALSPCHASYIRHRHRHTGYKYHGPFPAFDPILFPPPLVTHAMSRHSLEKSKSDLDTDMRDVEGDDEHQVKPSSFDDGHSGSIAQITIPSLLLGG
jgi:hypothetical protein